MVTGRKTVLVTGASGVLDGHVLRELGYRITPLDVLLDDTIAWMRGQGMVGAHSPSRSGTA